MMWIVRAYMPNKPHAPIPVAAETACSLHAQTAIDDMRHDWPRYYRVAKARVAGASVGNVCRRCALEREATAAEINAGTR